MTKPSREDFERFPASEYSEQADRLRKEIEKWQGFPDLITIPFDMGPVAANRLYSALRVAADQMTEREKVVAVLNDLAEKYEREEQADPTAAGASPSRALWGAIAAIERGDHSSAKPASGWRTMETAPRDGSAVLIATAEGGVGEARWCDDEGHEGFYWAQTHWTDATGPSEPLSPVGWQPLPSPPGPDTSHA